MASGLVVVDIPQSAPKPQLPLRRLSENFFQRWFLILLPLVLMTMIGVLLAQRVQPQFLAEATLSASANPLIDPIGEQDFRFGESEAEQTARVMIERLGTDRFAASVVDAVGLTEAIESTAITYDDIRQNLSIFATGDSIVKVEVTWGDPETAIALVAETIAAHQEVLTATVTADSRAAVEFFNSRLSDAIADEQSAEEALNAYVDTLPPLQVGEETPVADELALRRLNSRLTTAQATIDETRANIEEAELSVVQAESEAGRSLNVIDAASSNFEPQSTLPRQAIILFVFLVIGFLVALTMLLLSTHLDRSVRSAVDIEAAGGGLTVAAVPVIKSLRSPKAYQRALGAGRRAS